MIDLSNEQSWVIVMVNNIMIEVLSSIAEQEYNTIHQRQSEGIAAAKAKGKHLGRPKLIKPDNWDFVISEYRLSRITAKEAMTRLNLKRSSFYKLLKSEQDRSWQKWPFQMQNSMIPHKKHLPATAPTSKIL